jgi:hypothetical protein
LQTVDLLALYAAAVATASIGWQIYSQVQGRKNRLTVSTSVWSAGEEDDPANLQVKVVNPTEHPIRVVEAGIVLPGDRVGEFTKEPADDEVSIRGFVDTQTGEVTMRAFSWNMCVSDQSLADGIPGVIPAHDGGTVQSSLADAPFAFDPDEEEFSAYAIDSSENVFYSREDAARWTELQYSLWRRTLALLKRGRGEGSQR